MGGKHAITAAKAYNRLAPSAVVFETMGVAADEGVVSIVEPSLVPFMHYAGGTTFQLTGWDVPGAVDEAAEYAVDGGADVVTGFLDEVDHPMAKGLSTAVKLAKPLARVVGASRVVAGLKSAAGYVLPGAANTGLDMADVCRKLQNAHGMNGIYDHLSVGKYRPEFVPVDVMCRSSAAIMAALGAISEGQYTTAQLVALASAVVTRGDILWPPAGVPSLADAALVAAEGAAGSGESRPPDEPSDEPPVAAEPEVSSSPVAPASPATPRVFLADAVPNPGSGDESSTSSLSAGYLPPDESPSASPASPPTPSPLAVAPEPATRPSPPRAAAAAAPLPVEVKEEEGESEESDDDVLAGPPPPKPLTDAEISRFKLEADTRELDFGYKRTFPQLRAFFAKDNWVNFQPKKRGVFNGGDKVVWGFIMHVQSIFEKPQSDHQKLKDFEWLMSTYVTHFAGPKAKVDSEVSERWIELFGQVATLGEIAKRLESTATLAISPS